MVTHEDLVVKSLGPCRVDSPLLPLLEQRKRSYYNVDESDRVLFDDTVSALVARGGAIDQVPGFEPAGPRRRIFFDPSKTRAGIVTCGGLCPGFNDVIRALVMELHFAYGVHRIHGFCNGYQGFIPKYKRTGAGVDRAVRQPDQRAGRHDPGDLAGRAVSGRDGRLPGADGDQRPLRDRRRRHLARARTICGEIEARGSKIAVVGIPKTIDNDIMFIDQSFGFQTAFSVAADVIRTAHAEAKASPNGVGLVKLMGRHSGLIACYASLAHNDANFVLIPEVPFALDGERGFLNAIKRRVQDCGHAVVVVAEGAGQDLLESRNGQSDASGNARLGDIGVFLKDKIGESFAAADLELNLKYFDPSYMVRSVKANPFDAVFCLRLAHNAVHAAMAGRTEVVVSRWHGRFVLLPIPLAVRDRHVVDPNGDLWLSVLESTGQPPVFG